MKEKVNFKSLLLASIITLLIGVVFIVFSEEVIDFLNYIVGIAFALLGLVNIILYLKTNKKEEEGPSFKFAIGVLLVMFGVYLLYNDTFVLDAVGVIFGFYVIVNGVLGVQFSLNAKKSEDSKWKISLIVSLISIALGILILLNPFGAIMVLIKYIGIIMLITGVLNIALLIINKNQMPQTK